MAELQYPPERDSYTLSNQGIQRRSQGSTSHRLSSGPVSSRFQERLSKSSGFDDAPPLPTQNGQTHYSTSSHHPSTPGNSTQRWSDQEQQGLSELAAPDITNQRRGQNPSYLEDNEEPQMPVELTAPPPVQRQSSGNGNWPRSEHLESQRENKMLNQEPTKTKNEYSSALTQLYMISNLIFFSILGTLARLGTQWLGFYPGAIATTSNLWANFGGCFFMGFLVEDRQLFQEEWGERRSWHGDVDEIKKAHKAAKKTIPLFAGLTVGFCGSYTSFSTFMRDVFLAISNDVSSPPYYPSPNYSPTTLVDRPRGYSFNAVVAVILLQVIMNLGALQLGAHLAKALDGHMPTIPFRFIRNFLEPLIVVLGIGCWIGSIVMTAIPPDRPGGPLGRGRSWDMETWRGQVLFALVFAPVGCILRWFLSIKLNSVISSFPLGTYAANIFGTAVFAFIYDLQHAPLLISSIGLSKMVGGGHVGCQVMQGVLDGFCGCLTTVSTWVVELDTLKLKHSYIYGSASVLTGMALVVAIMGGVRWTVGFWELVCVVENS